MTMLNPQGGGTGVGRRMLLRGGGAALLLPKLASLQADEEQQQPPRRFLGLYVGHGFAITRREDHPARDWSWYPRVENGGLRFGKSMQPMQKFADQISVFRGLEHPQVVSSNGHSSADSFLTGSNPEGSVISPSLDQVAAAIGGRDTRYPSLVLGNEGGLGASGSSLTLSYTPSGRPIPSSCDLVRIYNQLFNSDPQLIAAEKAEQQRSTALVDRVFRSASRLQRRVSAEDNQQIESYLEAVRDIERNIERMQRWSDTPRPEVGQQDLSLQATVNEPQLFIRTMYQLIFLAFRTDSTRYVTYMLQSMIDGAWNDMPRNALGLPVGHHRLAHAAAGSGQKAMENLGTYDRFQAEMLAEFLQKLADTPEQNGSLLDNTLIFYGTSNSVTHVNRDYPLLIAGGRNLGFRQGVFHDLQATSKPLSSLYLTFLQQLGISVERFSDSDGILPEVLA